MKRYHNSGIVSCSVYYSIPTAEALAKDLFPQRPLNHNVAIESE